jgi:redox-sensitive bicupin YhaK (pirin superfamily)
MQKKIAITYHGQMSQVGELKVKRLLPNRYTRTVGPFFFLDYLVPTIIEPKKAERPNGEHAHPHRGIATFTYLFNGELEHFDSRGHQGIVGAGGAQWMKAGNGIIHDENPTGRFQESGGLMHGMQFWINLPAMNKAEPPEYLAVQNEDFPVVLLPDNNGQLKVLIGAYDNLKSPVQTYTRQFNYHLKLNPKASFKLTPHPDFESALFIPSGELNVNGAKHGNGELLVFEITGEEIEITNTNDTIVDIIIFGGEGYTEPIIAEGPFVMNSQLGIAEAYRDYANGKYGEISYTRD